MTSTAQGRLVGTKLTDPQVRVTHGSFQYAHDAYFLPTLPIHLTILSHLFLHKWLHTCPLPGQNQETSVHPMHGPQHRGRAESNFSAGPPGSAPGLKQRGPFSSGTRCPDLESVTLTVPLHPLAHCALLPLSTYLRPTSRLHFPSNILS